jgi:hypothetical protein
VREAPDQCDERLVKAMKANPGANITALAEAATPYVRGMRRIMLRALSASTTEADLATTD